MNKVQLTWSDIVARAQRAALTIQGRIDRGTEVVTVYPVPRGGIYAAQAIMGQLASQQCDYKIVLVEDPEDANFIVDDLVDSGATRRLFLDAGIHPNQFITLANKQEEELLHQRWVEFPWERMSDEERHGPEDNVRRLLEFIGEDCNREGLVETPARVLKSYAEIFAGYKQDPTEVMKTFEQDTCDEMIIVRNIEFYSVCEHHMQPFFGKAHIAYIPNGRVLGVSKLARVLDIYARRLQIQERITQQITKALMENLKPLGAACVLEAKHFCMVCRGVQKQNSDMITSSLEGRFRQPEVRAEFLNLIKD